MKIIMLGPPGAGKGTQAESISRKLFIPHISTGDLFRSAIAAGTKLGNTAKEYINSGQLVPDELTMGLVKDRLSQSDCAEGYLLDGIPRTIEQATALDAILEEAGSQLDAAININVPLDLLMDRLTGRRICKCGATYHMLYNPPVKEGICDKCQGVLYQRDDDTEETVKNRLTVYTEQSRPVEDFYQAKGILININGDQPVNMVLAEIGEKLGLDWK